MSMAPQAIMGVNPQNFSHMAQTPAANASGTQSLLPNTHSRGLQSEMQQAYMNGVTDPFELMQLQN